MLHIMAVTIGSLLNEAKTLSCHSRAEGGENKLDEASWVWSGGRLRTPLQDFHQPAVLL